MLEAIYGIVGVIIGLIARSYLPGYLGQKGKNLATKEDVAEITTKIESVKHDYAKQLESTRSELSAQLNTHSFRYEKEYEVLSDLTSLLVDLRDASLNLRPIVDLREPGKSDQEIKQERLKKLYEAMSALYLLREKKRPFYPDDVYTKLTKIQKEAHSESVGYRYRDESTTDFAKYWEEAEKNQEQITNIAEKAMSQIRERITKWEKLIDGL